MMNIEKLIMDTHGHVPRSLKASVLLAESMIVPEEKPDFACAVQVRIGSEHFPAVLVLSNVRLLFTCRKMAFSRFYSVPLSEVKEYKEYNALNYQLKITTHKTGILVQMNKNEGEKLAAKISGLLNEKFDYEECSSKLFSDAYARQKFRLKKRAEVSEK